MRALVAGTALLLSSAALAESVDDGVIRRCAATNPPACWVSENTLFCRLRFANCLFLRDRTVAHPIRREREGWIVQTAHGTAWVSDDALIIDPPR